MYDVTFNLYIEAFLHFLTVTENAAASNEKKKSLLKAVGGPDMVFLFKHMGKVTQENPYDVAIQNI